MIRLLFFALIIAPVHASLAYGHFFGSVQNVDRYQVVFAPYPDTPVAGSNSTLLNFSILENGTNIYNIYSAALIKEKSGKIIAQVPYRLYEFSDITIPYTFNKTGDYVVTLQTRISGDAKYQTTPLEASFDISIGNQLIAFDELMLLYITPAAVTIAGITLYLHSKKKL
jgi:hypothetical protein